MAGLGNPAQAVPMQAAPSGAETPPEGMMQDQSMETGEGGEPATPEEQAEYEKMMDAIGNVLYPENRLNPAVLQQISGKMGEEEAAIFQRADPPFDPDSSRDALAGTAVLLLVTVDSKLGFQEKANSQDEDANPNYSAVIMAAGSDLIGMLAENAESASVHEYSDDEVNNAALRAVDLYQQVSPTLDRGVMKERFMDLAMADKEGRLGEVLPGLPGGEPMQQPAPQGAGLGQGMR